MNEVRDALPPELAAESKFKDAARLGFLARGLLYIVIAALVIGTGRTEDLAGALGYLDRGAGRILLVLLAVGTAGYGLWRWADAALGIEHPGWDPKAAAQRVIAAVIGAIYLYLAYKAVTILLVGRTDSMTVEQQADTVLDLPAGGIVLGLAALIFAGAGAYQLREAVGCKFLGRLDQRAQEPLVKWLGRLGYAARGVIFLLTALLIGRAALDEQSTEAGGMEQALDLMSGPTLYAVAAGLALFGVFSIIEARYRRINEPRDGELEQGVRDMIGR